MTDEIEVVVGEVVEPGTVLAPTRGEGYRPSLEELRAEWNRAFDGWLEERAISPKTQTAYTVAWDDLWSFVDGLPDTVMEEDGRPPRVTEFWEITHRHIRAWIDDLRTRTIDRRRVAVRRRRGNDQAVGYSASTINQRLAAVSSFYSYAEQNWPVTLADGRDVPLTLVSYMTMNPVRVIAKRPTARPERDQGYLSPAQLRAFLGAIRPNSLTGARDLALFRMYVMTGARNTEARTLTWGDIQERGGRYFWYWRGKGRESRANKEGWKELPPEVWEAMERFLKAAGRWGRMQNDSYIFTAVTDRAANLPTVNADEWDPCAQPLSAREVNRLAKRYARRAGLDPDDVHVHTLRHSAAMLMDEVGASVEDIRQFLNHESLETTQAYLHAKRGQRNVHAAKMAELLNL